MPSQTFSVKCVTNLAKIFFKNKRLIYNYLLNKAPSNYCNYLLKIALNLNFFESLVVKFYIILAMLYITMTLLPYILLI